MGSLGHASVAHSASVDHPWGCQRALRAALLIRDRALSCNSLFFLGPEVCVADGLKSYGYK